MSIRREQLDKTGTKRENILITSLLIADKKYFSISALAFAEEPSLHENTKSQVG